MPHRVRARVLCLALAVSVLLIAAVGAVPAGAAQPGTVPDITWGTSRADIDKTIALMKTAGVQWVRTAIPWNAIEPNRKGVYNEGFLADIDYAIRRCREAGIKVIVPVQDGVPYWASADPNKHDGSWQKTYHPRNYQDFGDFFAFIVNRYKGLGIHAYEVWNEPNLKRFWASGVSAAGFAQMLRAAYPAIKHADPSATVIMGGLSGNDHAYLASVYAHGGGRYFDAVGAHPYAWGDPTKCWTDGSGHKARDAFCGLQETRRVMVENGDRDKAIWITEMGWSTCSNAASGCQQSGVSQVQQADYTTKAFRLLDERYGYVRVALVYNFRNDSWLHDDRGDWEAQTGLLTTHFTPKPAFAAFRAYALTKSSSPDGWVARRLAVARHRTWTSMKVLRRPQRRALVSGHVGGGLTHGRVILRFQRVARHRWVTVSVRPVPLRADGTYAFLVRRAGRHGRWRVRSEFRGSHAYRPSRSHFRRLRLALH
jgi:hypothetical protein